VVDVTGWRERGVDGGTWDSHVTLGDIVPDTCRGTRARTASDAYWWRPSQSDRRRTGPPVDDHWAALFAVS